ncbi:hypothetical protein Tco_1311186 [Tanacetum coccineum]
MDNPNITMEEYIRLEEEKSKKREKVFKWETARYGKIWENWSPRMDTAYYGKTNTALVLIRHMALPPRDQRHQYLRGLPDLIAEGLSTRMLMEHRDAQGQMLDLDTPRALQFHLGRVRRRMSWKEFILALGLHSAEEMQTAGGVAEEALVAPGDGDKDEEMPQAGQREVLDSMAHDFSRFTTWTVTSLARLMDRAGVPYTRYLESPVEYQRRLRQRTDGASTFTAPQQPDP